MIQQDYEIGGDTTLSTWQQLSNETADWRWEHRTLVGFRKEDGTIVAPGEITQFDTQAAQVSGVWELNKSEFPLKIYFVGSSGTVSAEIIEHNGELPLADNSHPYENTTRFDSSQSSFVSVDIYHTDSVIDILSITLSPAANTTIKSISIGTQIWQNTEGHSQISCRIANYDYVNYDGCINILSSNIDGPVIIWSAYNTRTYGLSVEFVQGGILTYIPNTNTINPNHPDLNN